MPGRMIGLLYLFVVIFLAISLSAVVDASQQVKSSVQLPAPKGIMVAQLPYPKQTYEDNCIKLPKPKKSKRLKGFDSILFPAELPLYVVPQPGSIRLVPMPKQQIQPLVHAWEKPVVPLPDLSTLHGILSYAIAKNPDILLQHSNVQSTRGTWQTATGTFDTVINANAFFNHVGDPFNTPDELALGIPVNNTDTTDFTLDFSKKLITGVTLTPSVNIERQSSSLQRIQNRAREDRGTVDFGVSIPILKGGTIATTSETRSARLTYQAAIFDTLQQVSTTISDTAQAYWDYLAALENYRYRLQAQARSKKLLESTILLAKKNETPRADIDLAAADYNIKKQEALDAYRNIYETRAALATVIGLDPRVVKLLPLPSNPFPSVNYHLLNAYKDIDLYTEIALHARNDLTASRLTALSRKVEMEAAADNRKPTLDLKLNIGYSGLNETNDYFSSLGDNVHTTNYRAELDFSHPPANNASEGAYYTASAEYIRQSITEHNLARTISINVAKLSKQLRITAQQLAIASHTVRLFIKSVNDENIKFRLGAATIIDVIQTQDKLLTAELEKVSEQQNYAKILVQFKFEVGLLVEQEDGHYKATLSTITQ